VDTIHVLQSCAVLAKLIMCYFSLGLLFVIMYYHHCATCRVISGQWLEYGCRVGYFNSSYW